MTNFICRQFTYILLLHNGSFPTVAIVSMRSFCVIELFIKVFLKRMNRTKIGSSTFSVDLIYGVSNP